MTDVQSKRTNVQSISISKYIPSISIGKPRGVKLTSDTWSACPFSTLQKGSLKRLSDSYKYKYKL